MGNGTRPQSDAGQSPAPGPGVRSLIQGGGPATAPQPAVEPVEKPAVQSAVVPAWYFYALDLLLVALAVGLMWMPGAVSWKTLTFQTALVALGGVLSVFGVLKFRNGN